MDDIIIKKLVNLRFMHFPDKTIDCKFAGRPYLIYKIEIYHSNIFPFHYFYILISFLIQI